MLKSVFGLVKSNQGKFKSDKQKAFMLAKAIGYVYSERQSFHFGEWEYKNSNNTAFVEWTVEFSNQGVERIVKTTSKAQIVWWENTPEHLAKVAKEQKIRNTAKLVDLKAFYVEANNQLESFKEDNKAFLSNFDLVMSIKEKQLAEAPEELKPFCIQDIAELNNKKESILAQIASLEDNLAKVVKQIKALS